MERLSENPELPILLVQPELKELGIKAKGAVLQGVDVRRNLSGPLKKEIGVRTASLAIPQILKSPILAGYRELYQRFHSPDSKPAAEGLLELIQKNRRLPNINNVVDLYNVFAAETGLAIGAHDLSKIHGNVEIRLTNGSEHFTPLGQTDPIPVPSGIYAAVDESGEVLCWMETRQSEVTKVEAGKTKDVFIYVQGNRESSEVELQKVLNEICHQIVQYCGGRSVER